MVVVEVMVVGKVVFVSKKGGISEFVLDGIMGYYFVEFMLSDSIINDINCVFVDKECY